MPKDLLDIPPAAVELEWRGDMEAVEVGGRVEGQLVKDPASGLLILEPA